MEKLMDDEILGFILYSEKEIDYNHKKTFSAIIERIDRMTIGLAKKQLALIIRINEKKQNKKRMSSYKLKEYVDRHFSSAKVDYSEGFTKKDAKYYINKLLNNSNKEIANELNNMEETLKYCFALKKAFFFTL